MVTVELENDFILFRMHGDVIYDFDMKRHDAAERITGLREKKWFTPDVENSFIDAIEKYIDDVFRRIGDLEDLEDRAERIKEALK